MGSDAEMRWRHDLYNVRHRVVDSGCRGLTQEEARAAVSAGTNATVEIEQTFPDLVLDLGWDRSLATLPQLDVKGSFGRALGMFGV